MIRHELPFSIHPAAKLRGGPANVIDRRNLRFTVAKSAGRSVWRRLLDWLLEDI